MTREEAIKMLKSKMDGNTDTSYEWAETVRMAIKALEKESTTKIEESNFSQEQYLADIQSAYDCGKSVLDKIRAEIEVKLAEPQYQHEEEDWRDGLIIAETIIDEYKAESEG